MNGGSLAQSRRGDLLAAQQATFAAFTAPMLGLPVTQAWNGAGSTLHLEFGSLQPGRIRRDGRAGYPQGTMCLALYDSWRLEGRRSILCSSDTDDLPWPKLLTCLTNGAVVTVTANGRLPELSIELSTGLRIVSFALFSTQPNWMIFDRRNVENADMTAGYCLGVFHGRLRVARGDEPWAW